MKIKFPQPVVVEMYIYGEWVPALIIAADINPPGEKSWCVAIRDGKISAVTLEDIRVKNVLALTNKL